MANPSPSTSSLLPAKLSRSPVYSCGDVVASASPLAASVGLEVLSAGGNAFDAAVAVAAAETVVLPGRCGIGGEVFAVMWDARAERAVGLSASGAAPQAASAEALAARGHTERMPTHGPLAVSPPGEVAALAWIAERYGSKPLAELLAPAIRYAEQGFPISRGIARSIAKQQELIRNDPASAAIFLRADGSPWREAEILVQRDLATTWRRVAEDSAETFYRGALAHEIGAGFALQGGLISAEDLAAMRVEEYEPLQTSYRGHTVLENRPPSQGLMLLEMLNLVEGYDLAGWGACSPESVHVMVEATKLAFADRNATMGDCDGVPVETLIDKAFAERRRHEAISLTQASRQPQPAPLGGESTSSFCVADRHGNVVSFIHSLYHNFGSCFTLPGTGMLFNNRQRGFRLTPGHANSLTPGRRPMHTLNAYMLVRDGHPVLAGNSPGGDAQVQINLQLISAVVDHGLGPQEAIEQVRWMSSPGSDPDELGAPPKLAFEAGAPPELIAGLREKGHDVVVDEMTELFGVGRIIGLAQLIALDPQTGVRTGASDPRADGHAVAR